MSSRESVAFDLHQAIKQLIYEKSRDVGEGRREFSGGSLGRCVFELRQVGGDFIFNIPVGGYPTANDGRVHRAILSLLNESRQGHGFMFTEKDGRSVVLRPPRMGSNAYCTNSRLGWKSAPVIHGTLHGKKFGRMTFRK